MSTITPDGASTLSLESQLEQLALESEALANVIETFRSVIPNLVTSLREKLAILRGDDREHYTDTTDFKKNFDVLKNRTNNVAFTAYAKTLVMVPEGFNGNLVEYLAFLERSSPAIFSEAQELLAEYNTIIAAFISNKESKISLKDHTAFFERVEATRSKINDELNTFFTGKAADSNKTRIYLGTVINRFAELETAAGHARKLEVTYANQNLKAIADGTNRVVELLNILIRSTSSTGVSKVSGPAAMNISKGAYTMGRFIEFISIYRFHTQLALKSYVTLVKQLNEIL